MSTDHSRASDRERKRQARLNESEDQKCKRLASMRKRAKDRLRAESTEQKYLVVTIVALASTLLYYRESRLLNLREGQSTRLAQETPEER